jgi:hypothetical protein
MPDTHIEQSFRRLLHLLHSSELAADERQTRITEEVLVILEALPSEAEGDQQGIRAALYALGLLPERRSGQDRRLASGKPRQRVVSTDRRGMSTDRRQPRNVARWIGSWE